MIVQPTPDGLLLVEQAEHARQAGVLARALRVAPEPRRAFERATEIHDDGWIEADAAPLLSPSGVPLSFREYPAAPYAAVWERGIARAVAESPYVGLLVSLHGSRFFGSQPDLQAGLHAREDALLLELGESGSRDSLPPHVRIHHLWIDYLDRLSLMTCAGWPSPQRAEIGGVSYQATWADGTMNVEPWPFGPALAAPLEGRLLDAARPDLGRARRVGVPCAVRPVTGS